MIALNENRIRLAIVLITLILCAFFLAQGASRLVASMFLSLEEGETLPAPRVDPAQAGAVKLASANADINVQQLLKHNIFDSQLGPQDDESIRLAAASEGGTEGEVLPSGEPPPPGMATVCAGGLKLVGAFVDPVDAEWSIAAVNSGGKSLLYRGGQSVDGKTIFEVRETEVLLQTGGSFCRVAMFEGGGAASPAPASIDEPDERPSRRRPNRNKGALSDEKMAAGIKKISDTKYSVTRSFVDELLGDQSALMTQAKLIPHRKNGEVVGVRMIGIRRDSLLSRLGMRSGDMLKTINGYDMSKPNSALEAYTKLRSADALTLSMERAGKPITIDYTVTK